MLKYATRLSCPGQAWFNRSCQSGTVVGWLVPMVQSWVRAWVRAERCYRLLSYSGSAAQVEQLRTALAAEKLVQPAAEKAARQSTAAAAIAHSSSGNNSSRAAAAAISSRAATKSGQLHSSRQQDHIYTYSTCKKLNSHPNKRTTPYLYLMARSKEE